MHTYAYIHIVLQRRAHGRCTLPWAQTGGWADILSINIVYYHKCSKQGK